MPATCVVGMQWGDEGKGKIVDLMSADCDMVVRYQGGSNAGHKVVIGGETYAMHQVPTGILRPGVECLMANGMVVDPEELLKEVEGLTARGIEIDGRLWISDRAHVVMPYHKELERLSEAALGDRKIGSTLRGIGPCYTDKASRSGLRVADLVRRTGAAERLRAAATAKNREIERLFGGRPLDVERLVEQHLGYAEWLRPRTCDTTECIHQALDAGRKVFFEGAQGSLLDLDFGTYPFVTSSNASAAGLAAGAGVSPRRVGRFIGVAKAYTSRVGAGPFPTELSDDIGQRIRERGHEYGTTTGRPRRTGWFDGVVVRYAVRIGQIDELALTLTDVLTGLDPVRVCVAYDLGGRRLERVPADVEALGACRPVYEDLPGWHEDVSDVKSFDRLPTAMRDYVALIERQVGAPVRTISVGPEREQTIRR
jgi:adenylosuccinate synthase